MHEREPDAIFPSERRERIRRVRRLARRLEFVGRVEYLHVSTRSGGAQYCKGPSRAEDLLLVYARAFERDADPNDFGLEAIIAHEVGHQRLARNPHLAVILQRIPGDRAEEVLASLVGALLLGDDPDALALEWKATAEFLDMDVSVEAADAFVKRLLALLEQFL